MTCLPQELRQSFFWQIPQHSEQNGKLKITKKLCKVPLINVFSQKIWNTPKMRWGKFRESFVYVYNCEISCTCHPKKNKYGTPKSKIQNPTLKTPISWFKWVRPQSSCPTSLSAQQLLPQRLKNLNPLLPILPKKC